MPARLQSRRKTAARSPHSQRPRVPKYRRHKATGQGYVVLNGKAIYLGGYDDPATQQRYQQLIAEWVASGRQAAPAPYRARRSTQDEMAIRHLMARYWQHAQTYYRLDGQPTSQLHVIASALRPLRELYGDTPAAAFKPLALKAVRQRMIELGWSRTTVNQAVSRIKHLFRWAVENELVDGPVFHALQAVSGLRRGRCDAREPAPVLPVAQACIDAIHPFVSDPVWAMIQLQLLTGARAGEIVMMRRCDLDMTGRVWVYTPVGHKTAHLGHRRAIYLGPQAQGFVSPFLARPPEAYLFSPAEAEARRREQLHEDRETPLSCGNRPGTNRRRWPMKTPGDRYTVGAYHRAIARACDHAFPPPEPLARRPQEKIRDWQARLTSDQKEELAKWQREHRWHPHQLRHNAATQLRKEFGIETARIILGHRSAAVTEVYAELDRVKAIDVMLRVG